jgi:hypothetical protein
MFTHDDLVRRDNSANDLRQMAELISRANSDSGQCHEDIKNVSISFGANGIMVRATVRKSAYIRTRMTSREEAEYLNSAK